MAFCAGRLCPQETSQKKVSVLTYDYVFIGAGISSLMAAHRIKEKKPSAAIAILEKGRPLAERVCPIIEKKTDKCLKCAQCAIVSGVAGAGAKNDGKYIIPSRDSVDYGGWLMEYLPVDTVIGYIKEVDAILLGFADREYPLYTPSLDFKQECLKHDLHLRTAVIRHYGSDGNYQVMAGLVAYLEQQGIDIITDADITGISLDDKTVTTTADTYGYGRLILAVGRTGAPWFSSFCRKNGVALVNNRVDVGVRVEVRSEICHEIAKSIYEPKIYYRSKSYGDMTRTFCWNNGDARVRRKQRGRPERQRLREQLEQRQQR